MEDADRISVDTARSLARIDLLLAQVQETIGLVRAEIDRVKAGEGGSDGGREAHGPPGEPR